MHISEPNLAEIAFSGRKAPFIDRDCEAAHPELHYPTLSEARLRQLCIVQEDALKLAFALVDPLCDQLDKRRCLHPAESTALNNVRGTLLEALLTCKRMLCAWEPEYRELFRIMEEDARRNGKTPPRF